MEMNYERRASGILPHIEIAGIDFTVDWRLFELRETDAPWNHIRLDYIDLSDDGEWYLLLFDTATHQVFDFHDEVTEVPDTVVFLQIPDETKLDPVALARQFRVDPLEFIQEHPILPSLKAMAIPLSETNIPALVAQNRRRMENGWNDIDEDSPRRIGR